MTSNVYTNTGGCSMPWLFHEKSDLNVYDFEMLARTGEQVKL